MTGYEKLAPVTCHYHIDPCLFRFRKQGQSGNFQNIFLADFRVAAVGNIKHIVKPTENGIQRLQGAMFEYAEHFRVQRILGHTVMVVESGLRRPADIKRGRNVRTRPIEYFGYLVPVGHFLKVHLLHRGSGNNHTVVLLVTHLVEIRIESFHMFYRSIL